MIVQDVTPLEMTGAYATLAAHGIRRYPIPIAQIKGPTGKVLSAPKRNGTRVVGSNVVKTYVCPSDYTQTEQQASHSPVAIHERVNGFKAVMRDGGTCDRFVLLPLGPIDPFLPFAHKPGYITRRWRSHVRSPD